jgi:predicted amino acid dehydrogenase
MIDRTTGATEAQIEAACQSRMTEQFAGDDSSELTTDRQRHHVASMVRVIAPHLVPPGSLIFDDDDIAALRRVLDAYKAAMDALNILWEGTANASDAHDDSRLTALIGDDGNG